VNLLPRDRPQDVYKDVCALVARKIAEDAHRYAELKQSGKLGMCDKNIAHFADRANGLPAFVKCTGTLTEKERKDLKAAQMVNGLVDRKVPLTSTRIQNPSSTCCGEAEIN
jgi:hypothetical protein